MTMSKRTLRRKISEAEKLFYDNNFPEFQVQSGEGLTVEIFSDNAGWLQFGPGDIVEFINSIWELNWTEDDLVTAIEEHEKRRKIEVEK